MDRTGDQASPPPLCERSVNGVTCAKSHDGGPAQAVDQVNGRWYCKTHIGAAKAVVSKRRDRGFGTCSVPGCSRPAVAREGKCNEHRAAERASDATVVIVDDGSGRGDHPYAPKRSEIYLAVFTELGILKVGKATPWTVRERVNDAADKSRIRQTDNGTEQPITSEPVAWAIPLFGDKPVLWAVTERVEHATAGRLAHNVGAKSVGHAEGKEWLRHDGIGDIDWRIEFHRAVCQTLAFLGHHETDAGDPRLVD